MPRESQLHTFRAQDCPQHTRVGHSPFGDKLRSLGWNCSLREMANKPSRLPRGRASKTVAAFTAEKRENSSPSNFQASSLLHNRTPGALMILLPIDRPAPGPATTGRREGGRETPTWGRNKQQVAKKEGKVKWRHVAPHVTEKAKVPSDRKGGQSALHISRSRPYAVEHFRALLHV